MLRKLLLNNLLVTSFVVLGSISYAALISDEIKQDVRGKGIGVVHTGKGDVIIGITLDQYEERLKEKEQEVTVRLAKAHSKEKEFWQAQLDTIKKKSADLKNSYKEHVEDLRKRITQLESIRGQVPDKLLREAKTALARGDTKKAEEIFKDIEKQSEGAIKVTAEAKYQRCKIEGDNIHYYEAFSLCTRAVQLVPDNTLYLLGAGVLAYALDEYQQAINYYEQALRSDIKRFGEDHRDVARDRNNLGLVWEALGENRKAIAYLEKALVSLLKRHGEHCRQAKALSA